MIATALLAALAATPGCERVRAAVAEEELAGVEAGLGTQLLLPGDPPQGRAALTGRRWAQACALLARGGAPARVDRQRLAELLAREELAGARDLGGDPLEERVGRIGAWLKSLLLSRAAQSFSEAARVAVLGATCLCALGGGAWAAARLRRKRRGLAASLPRSEGTPQLDDPAEHLSRARAALRSDTREAIREGLLALLSALERRSWARPDRAKTNRELAAELPRRGAPPELSAAVERLLGWYDPTFYSLEPVPGGEAEQFVEEIDRLRRGLAGAAVSRDAS